MSVGVSERELRDPLSLSSLQEASPFLVGDSYTAGAARVFPDDGNRLAVPANC